MRRALILTGTALAVVAGTPAIAAECQSDLSALNEQISRNEQNYRVAAGAGLAGDLRKLRDAARIFAANGREEACRDIVAAVQEMLDDRSRELSGAENPIDGVTWVEGEITRIKGARSVSELGAPLRVAELIGADVRNARNEDLGEIEDVVFKPGSGEIEYAILAHGGFLGMAEEQVAVPWKQFKVTDDGDERVFVLNISEETLEKAPSFERDRWSEIDSEEWRRENDLFFMQNR